MKRTTTWVFAALLALSPLGVFGERGGEPVPDQAPIRPAEKAPRPCTNPEGLGPEMLLIEAGRFQMGSPEDEPERDDDEGPLHGVTIQDPFAIGRCEVTVAQFRRFVTETGYRTDAERGDGCFAWDGTDWKQRAGRDWRSPGFDQTEAHPVVCVSWRDARAYTDWLSARTGADYRLPSEAEWEYAARAGTTTPFSTGGCITTDQANYNGNVDYNDCGAKTGVYRERTVAAGSLPANPWGLREVQGNAYEWTQDCWRQNYEGNPPLDGAPWLESGNGDCSRRVVRGGSWGNGPRNLRSAFRDRVGTDVAIGGLGFRVARTL